MPSPARADLHKALYVPAAFLLANASVTLQGIAIVLLVEEKLGF